MPRATQAERRARTSAALVQAAAELVVEQGVRAVTLAAVGERAGYSRGIVTHSFGTRQALLETLARTAQVGFVPGVAHEPGLDRLLTLIDGYVAALGREGVAGRAFLVLWAEAATAPELTEIFRERDEGFRADLRADVAAGIAEGRVRDDLDPHEVAVAVLGQLRGIGIQRLVDPGQVDVERLRHSVTAQWRRALQAG